MIVELCDPDCPAAFCRCRAMAQNLKELIGILQKPGSMVVLKRLIDSEEDWKVFYDDGSNGRAH